MPSKNKRINLTVPPAFYEILQEVKKRMHFKTDTRVCIWLIEVGLVALRYGSEEDDDNA